MLRASLQVFNKVLLSIASVGSQNSSKVHICEQSDLQYALMSA